MEMAVKVQNLNFCYECGGYLINDPENGEVVCSQCGLVISEKTLDYSHYGKRAYSLQEQLNREQNGPLITPLTPTVGLHTTLSTIKITNPNLKRAAKWNSRMTWEERNLLIATTELKRISSNLNLPDFAKQAAIKLYKRVFKMKLLKGRSIDAMIVACIYYICRELQINRTLHEILEETACNTKTVRGCFKTIIDELHLKVPLSDPILLIPKYIAKLGLGSDIEKASTNILKSSMKLNLLSGRDPRGVCAGAIYLVCKLKKIKISQKKVSEATGASEVTVRLRYKEFSKKLNIKVKR